MRKFSAECLEGESLAKVRMQAAARAVELALEYRVPLEAAREARNRTRDAGLCFGTRLGRDFYRKARYRVFTWADIEPFLV